MQIILQEDVEKLGTRGQFVDVAEGYARNFLLPRKLGLEATPGNMKRLEKMRAVFAKKEATEKESAQKLAELLASVSLTLVRKAGENDQLFGSVTSGRHFRSPRRAGLHHRETQDHARRSDQARWRVRDSRQASSRGQCQRQTRSEKRESSSPCPSVRAVFGVQSLVSGRQPTNTSRSFFE